MENKLHFLLIHGSWHGSWAWENVSSKLSEKNFKVSCPNLTGLGERKHLISLRPSSGLTTFEAEKFFGLKLKRNVFRYDSLTENDFEQHN